MHFPTAAPLDRPNLRKWIITAPEEIIRQIRCVIAAGDVKNGDVPLKVREISGERTGRADRRGT